MSDPLWSLREAMAAAAADWLASLGPAERAEACFGFPADEERTRWYYTPTERGGLPLAEKGPVSQRLAHRLVASGLSEGGYNTAATVMGLENVLDAREGWRRDYDGRTVPHRGRDPQLYFISVFGDPGAGSWGWRVGGHHVALNYTLLGDGQVSASPLFLGANPASSPLVGPGRLRPLATEEDLARALLDTLAPDQRAAATLSETAPGDILQTNQPRIRPGPPEGLAGAGMLPQQRELLAGLVRQYLDRLPGLLADLQAGRVLGERLETVHFGWAGSAELGRPHYYRLQGPRLHIEYDNVQNGANHVHSVWRDPEGDFGGDVGQSSTG
ncbi:MAG TPA: DUF3500 domain-containing protein [Actinomycetes bacterium]|nr:DUF3500 domain-containing protein [Actinomycetes bacterium]